MVIGYIGAMAQKYWTVKILFPIGTLYPSQHGGPSNTIYWHAKALHKAGFEPICISTSLGVPAGSVPCDQWIESDYGKVRYTSEMFHSLPFRLIFHSLRHLPSSDVVHLTSLFYPPSFIVGLIAVLFGKEVVWSVRGNLESSAMENSPIRKHIILNAIKLVESRITFHTTSDQETTNTKKYFGHKTKVVQIPNFLELPAVVAREDINPKYLLYLGRLHPIKGLNNLIQSLSNSREFLKSEALLYIAGDDQNSYATQLKKQVASLQLSQKVEFLGQIEGHEKQKLLANAFFLILPSHTENFGNVVVEALAQGTPVLASKGTPWQELEEFKIGYWVENDAASLSLIIDQILKIELEAYQKMRKRANKFVVQEYNIYNHIEKWVELFKK